MKVTILGCGTSAGVPQLGCTCAVCRSDDPRDKRRRCSILVEIGRQVILFDSGPDLRAQLLDAGTGRIDALIYTHAHADHVHGVDDLRAINNLLDAPIEAYAHPTVFDRIRTRFAYAFEGGRSSMGGFWRPELRPNHIDAGTFLIGDIEVTAFRQKHGGGESWGFRIGRFGYSTDASELDELAFSALAGVEVWIVGALRERPHPSHAHLGLSLSWIERLKPRRAVLTHMNHEVSYRDWSERLPPGVEPAHDGLTLEL